jgi:beta-xylosidase
MQHPSTHQPDEPVSRWQRAEQLLRRMTLDEKVMQVSAIYPVGLIGTRRPPSNPVGEAARPRHRPPVRNRLIRPEAETVSGIQRHLVENTRLGIPAIFHNEALNGAVAPDFTVSPTAIGLAATWDPALVEQVADLSRQQMRSVGLLRASGDGCRSRCALGAGARDLRRGPLPRLRDERRLHQGAAGRESAGGCDRHPRSTSSATR